MQVASCVVSHIVVLGFGVFEFCPFDQVEYERREWKGFYNVCWFIVI